MKKQLYNLGVITLLFSYMITDIENLAIILHGEEELTGCFTYWFLVTFVCLNFVICVPVTFSFGVMGWSMFVILTCVFFCF